MFRNTFQAGYLSVLYSLGCGALPSPFVLAACFSSRHPSPRSRPLQLWEGEEAEGVRLVRDEELQSQVVEVTGGNIAERYIACPSHPKKTLGIKLPHIILIVKNVRTGQIRFFSFFHQKLLPSKPLTRLARQMNKYFSFEIEALDDKKLKRRFRASNYQVFCQLHPIHGGALLPLLGRRGSNASGVVQTQARVKPYICTMPLRLSEGWNQVQLNVADLMRRAYGTALMEISRGRRIGV